MSSSSFELFNLPNILKIEKLLNDSSYRESIEISSNFNTRLCLERKLRMPFLDPQTGVAQNHSNLYMKKSQRIPGLREGQIYTYPSARWRKSRRQYLSNSAYHFRPFSRFRENDFHEQPSTVPSLESTVEGVGVSASIGIGDTDSKDSHKDELPKEWYYDEMEMMDDFMDESDDYDYEKPYRRKKRSGRGSNPRRGGSSSGGTSETPTRRGRGGRGSRGGRKSNQNQATAPMLLDNSSNSSDKFNEFSRNRRGQMNPHMNSQHSNSPLNFEDPPIHSEQKIHPEDSDDRSLSSSSQSTSQSNSSHFMKGLHGKDKPVNPSPYCDFCLGDTKENKKTLMPEELVSCSDCGRSGHPTCLQFTKNMMVSVKKYAWQCIECKYCSICGTSDNDDQLLFCDDCDRGYHMYCLKPALTQPPEGSWSCKLCTEEFHTNK